MFVGFVIRHAMRMHRTLWLCVASPAVQYFSTLSHKRQDFRKKMLLDIKYMFSFPLQFLSEKFLVFRRFHRGTIIHVRRSSCEVPVILEICSLTEP